MDLHLGVPPTMNLGSGQAPRGGGRVLRGLHLPRPAPYPRPALSWEPGPSRGHHTWGRCQTRACKQTQLCFLLALTQGKSPLHLSFPICMMA